MHREQEPLKIKVGTGKADPPGVVSFSQLNMIDRCPYQYQQRYLEGRKDVPAFALGMGSAFHKGCEVQHLNKIDTGRNLSPADIDDAFSDIWNKGMEFGGSRDVTNYISWREVAKADHKISVKDAREKAHRALKIYHAEEAVKMDPVAVEGKVFVPFIAGRMFIGYIDVVHRRRRKNVATDMKLVGKKYDESAAENSMQLTSYAWSQEMAGGAEFHESEFHVVTKTKVPGIQILTTTVTEEKKQAFLRWSAAQLLIVDAGAFVGRTGMHCKWCGFSHNCPWYNGRGFGAVPGMKLTGITSNGKAIELVEPKKAPVKKKVSKKKVSKKKRKSR